MEGIINKEDNTPFAGLKADPRFRHFSGRFISPNAAEKLLSESGCACGPHIIDILIEEDSGNVYAAALCPGITCDQIEVSINGTGLYVHTNPVEEDKKSGMPFVWKCIRGITYAGECELPTEVIAEKAEAELENGVLYVKMPKTDAVKPKIVSVTTRQ